MKTLPLAIAAVTALALAATTAHAADYNWKPYIAADAQVYKANLPSVYDGLAKDHSVGLDVAIGVHPYKYLGAEVSYFNTGTASRNDISIKAYGGAFDAIGYLPVSQDGKFQLLGSLGVSRTHETVKFGTASASENLTRARYGVGAQLDINNNWAARARVIRTGADYTSFGVGVAYHF